MVYVIFVFDFDNFVSLHCFARLENKSAVEKINEWMFLASNFLQLTMTNSFFRFLKLQ